MDQRNHAMPYSVTSYQVAIKWFANEIIYYYIIITPQLMPQEMEFPEPGAFAGSLIMSYI